MIPENMAETLDGTFASEDEILRLKKALPSKLIPEWFRELIQRNRLGGVRFSVTESKDLSGLGVELTWLTPAQIIDEAVEAEPGLSMVPLGFLPVGACAIGSGDPYFLDFRQSEQNPPLVRGLHDCAAKVPFPEEGIESVSASLSEFFRSSERKR